MFLQGRNQVNHALVLVVNGRIAPGQWENYTMNRHFFKWISGVSLAVTLFVFIAGCTRQNSQEITEGIGPIDGGPQIIMSNELDKEKSSYLKSAAHQPVHWQAWGEEAFKKARTLDRPILLDIGAVWCHWCHVMDRESYESGEIAKIINENYVPIKVDRDERPDVDVRYQKTVSAISGQGGWPLTAFLTPEGKVFFGGTYFPPEEKHGRPAFGTLLERVAMLYQTKKEDVVKDAERLYRHLLEETSEGSPQELKKDLLDVVTQSMKDHFDPEHGGFGHAPKFPHTQATDLLFLVHGQGNPWAVEMALKTLQEMGRGGVYDQLGGGFHRYSVDERWGVPHFEKMSYDNGGLLVNYAWAYQASGGDLFYREIAEGIIRYLKEWGSDQERGGFYGSQDADISLDDDGDYFTWTRKEAEAVLTAEEAKVLIPYYDIFEQGEMAERPDRNVLFIARSPEMIAKTEEIDPERVKALISSGKKKMIEARNKRQAPFVDQTIYTNWNGTMIAAYLEAYRAFGMEEARDFALKTLHRLMRTAYRDGEGMVHSVHDGEVFARGIFDDQVQMIHALIVAFEVTGNWEYLDRAEELVEICFRRYWDDSKGGFFDRDQELASEGGLLDAPQKVIVDSPTPSGNGVAAQVLLKLGLMTGREDYGSKARKILEVFSNEAASSRFYAGAYSVALFHYLNPPLHAVIVGKKDSPETEKLIKGITSVYRPGKIITVIDPSELGNRSLPGVVAAQVETAALDKPTAFICAGTVCAEPTQDPAKAIHLVANFR
jgi:uncharacterized protein